jgi:SMC interacting uncharacterized protein involved in chromosome segregation
MDWDVIISAGLAGAAVKAAGDLGVAFLRKRRGREDPTIAYMSEQFASLMKASESYREEVRQDMDRMKEDFQTLNVKYETDMASMRSQYEDEISGLRQKIVKLTEEIVAYRRENGALHLLLKEKGIDIPDWVSVSQRKAPEQK